MKPPKNKKEFQDMVQKYETITLKDIKEVWKTKFDPTLLLLNGRTFCTANSLTGYGKKTTCTLCKKVVATNMTINYNCFVCVYGHYLGCITGLNNKTYANIRLAKTPAKLRDAFRKRAKHLRKEYKDMFDN